MPYRVVRQMAFEANMALPKTGLVKWTSGNASARDPETGVIAIKPSGVLFDRLTPDNLVLVDADGAIVEGDLKPSVDTASHLYVYRHRPDVHGIVHTHSKYATAFAVQGMDIPVCTTTSACLFGGPIPCSGLATIGEEEIGREIVENIGDMQAILLRNHGVFTIGKTVYEALKNAVYVEEGAEAVFLAAQLGPMPQPLGDNVIAAGRQMYLNDYGQTGAVDK